MKRGRLRVPRAQEASHWPARAAFANAPGVQLDQPVWVTQTIAAMSKNGSFDGEVDASARQLGRKECPRYPWHWCRPLNHDSGGEADCVDAGEWH